MKNVILLIVLYLFLYSSSVFSQSGDNYFIYPNVDGEIIEGVTLSSLDINDFFAIDVNGDRRQDILLIDDENNIKLLKSLRMWNTSGSGVVDKFVYQSANFGTQPADFQYRLIGDFNGDTYQDLFWAKQITLGGNTYLNFSGTLTVRESNKVYHSFSNSINQNIPIEATYSVGNVLVGKANKTDMIDELYIELVKTVNNVVISKWIVVEFVYYENTPSFVTYSPSLPTPVIHSTNAYTGDIDGDGDDDIINIARFGPSHGAIYVTWVDGPNSFTRPLGWAADVEIFQNYDVAIVGDFNGDGSDEISIHVGNDGVSTDRWYTYGEDDLSSMIIYGSGQGVESGVVSGDFDGDGFCDKGNLSTSKTKFYVAKSNNADAKQVGVTYYGEYVEASHYPSGAGIIPALGWSDTPPASGEYYNSQDQGNILKVLQAMDKCGFDFIAPEAMLITEEMAENAIAGSNDAFGRAWNFSKNLKTVFESSTFTNLKFYTVMFGGEPTSGDDSYAHSEGAWRFFNYQDDFTKRFQHIAHLMSQFKLKFTPDSNPNLLKHLGKPLMIFYTAYSYEFPLRYASNWNKTYKTWFESTMTNRTIPDRQFAVEANVQPQKYGPKRFNWTREGVIDNGMWSYGELENDREDEMPYYFNNPSKQLPPDAEMMSIVPGKFLLWVGATEPAIKRWYTVDFQDNTSIDECTYLDQWNQILKAQPQIVMVTNWNNYDEMMGIEGAFIPGTTTGYWRDHKNQPCYDFYLQATRGYIQLFKHPETPRVGDFIREEDETMFYEIIHVNPVALAQVGDITGLEAIDDIDCRPILKVPAGWFSKYAYARPSEGGGETGRSFSAGSFPNPFNPEVNIQFSLPEEGHVRLEIFNILGEQVSVLKDEQMLSGEHFVKWAPNNLASGTYIYRLNYEGQVITKKIMYLK